MPVCTGVVDEEDRTLLTGRWKVLTACNPVESVTLIAKVEVWTAVGVPLITPVAPVSNSPAGRLPVLIAQVYGAVPPDTLSV